MLPKLNYVIKKGSNVVPAVQKDTQNLHCYITAFHAIILIITSVHQLLLARLGFEFNPSFPNEIKSLSGILSFGKFYD